MAQILPEQFEVIHLADGELEMLAVLLSFVNVEELDDEHRAFFYNIAQEVGTRLTAKKALNSIRGLSAHESKVMLESLTSELEKAAWRSERETESGPDVGDSISVDRDFDRKARDGNDDGMGEGEK